MEQDYGQQYRDLYQHHWWWRAREQMVLNVLRQLDLPSGLEVLDVGCGDGLFFPELGRFGNVRGIEVDEGLLDETGPYRSQIHTRPLGDGLYQGWRFGLIIALDVLEHLEDDRKAVQDIAAMLEPGGFLIVTVPAFMSLWDRHDEINRHYRRYTTAEVAKLLDPVGEMRLLLYWFNGLYVVKRVIAAINRRRKNRIVQHRLPAFQVSSLLRLYCVWEARLLAPLRVPFGTSVVALVQRS